MFLIAVNLYCPVANQPRKKSYTLRPVLLRPVHYPVSHARLNLFLVSETIVFILK